MLEIKSILRTSLILIAIIAIWRGVWGALDMYLLPDSPGISFLVSIIIGIMIIILTNFKIRKMV